MIDLAVLRNAADGGPAEERVPITRRALREIVRELSQGRAAQTLVNARDQFDAVIDGIASGRMPGPVACLDLGEGA